MQSIICSLPNLERKFHCLHNLFPEQIIWKSARGCVGQVRCKISKSVTFPRKLPWVNMLVTRYLYYSVRFLWGKAMAPHSSTLAWKTLWTKEPGRLQSTGSLRVGYSRIRLSDFPFTFHFHALEKEMATHSSVLAWRISGTGEPGGLPSMGSHRVRHD